jgi:hypothetical protein
MTHHRPISAHTKPIRELHRSLSGRNTETTKVFVCGVIVSDGTARYPVIFNGKTYIVDKNILAALRSGETPETLELISVEEDAEPLEEDKEFSIKDHTAAMRRSGAFSR